MEQEVRDAHHAAVHFRHERVHEFARIEEALPGLCRDALVEGRRPAASVEGVVAIPERAPLRVIVGSDGSDERACHESEGQVRGTAKAGSCPRQGRPARPGRSARGHDRRLAHACLEAATLEPTHNTEKTSAKTAQKAARNQDTGTISHKDKLDQAAPWKTCWGLWVPARWNIPAPTRTPITHALAAAILAAWRVGIGMSFTAGVSRPTGQACFSNGPVGVP